MKEIIKQNGCKIRQIIKNLTGQYNEDLEQEVYLKVLYDNPMFYYVNQTVVRMRGTFGYWELLPEYLYTSREISIINNDIRNIIRKIRNKTAGFINDEFRLEKCLHDSVVRSVAYDYNSLKKQDSFNAHSIVGAFLDKRAVCEGIAKAFKLLCNEFGIKCIVVLGKADERGNFDGGEYHAWNLVKIRNESYYVDVTWDNMYEGELQHISYDYFNVTTKDIMLDHQPMGDLPICTSTDLNYFHYTNSFVSTFGELETLIDKRLGSDKIIFKALKNKGQFMNLKELERKTYEALIKTMFRRMCTRPFALVFNEMHNIGKIFFAG